jgi:hypothetical protein
MIVAQSLGYVGAQGTGKTLRWVCMRANIAPVETAFPPDGGQLLVYLPKWQDRQIGLLPCQAETNLRSPCLGVTGK